MIDPETPPALATMALRATVGPPVEQLVWYIIEARLPLGDARSSRVRVLVE